MWAFSLFSKSHIDHVNNGNLKIFRGVGVWSTFLAVMRCSYQFFAVLRYLETPNAPLQKCKLTSAVCKYQIHSFNEYLFCSKNILEVYFVASEFTRYQKCILHV